MKKTHTKEDLKKKLIDHMMGMDLNALDMKQLEAFADILNTIKLTEEKPYAEVVADMVNKSFGQLSPF